MLYKKDGIYEEKDIRNYGKAVLQMLMSHELGELTFKELQMKTCDLFGLEFLKSNYEEKGE